MRKIIGPLSDPAAYGGDPADAFDVIAPSLPGFAFSSPLTTEGMFFNSTADVWVKLMARLGHDRFATQGGDIGAYVSARLGHKYAEQVIGVHLHLAGPTMPPYPTAEDFAPEELEWGGKFAAFMAQGSGYMQIQRTRPQTIGFAMHDSPVGQAAWMVDKRRAWSDCGGDVEAVFSKDDLITNAMLYWLTETYVSSARHYYDAGPSGWSPATTASPRSKPRPRCSSSRTTSGCNRANGRNAITTSNAGMWPKRAAICADGAAGVLVEDIRAFFKNMRLT